MYALNWLRLNGNVRRSCGAGQLFPGNLVNHVLRAGPLRQEGRETGEQRFERIGELPGRIADDEPGTVEGISSFALADG